MKIVVIGVGYVGLATAATCAELGHQVTGLDIDTVKITRLRDGLLPIWEPGLEPLVLENIRRGRLTFTEEYAVCIDADVIFVTVDTPTGENWEIRLESLQSVALSLARHAGPEAVIILKSTVPPGTNDYFRRLFRDAHPTHHDPIIVSNPEFLREGQAVYDTFHPDRIVLGTIDSAGLTAMRELYEPVIHGRYDGSSLIPPARGDRRVPVPVVATTPPTAELIKYAANAFLATKISFINEIANLSELLGADVTEVAEGIGLDTRIGRQFLNAGLGFGGSCFPKDTKALSFKAGSQGYQFTLLNAVIEVNKLQRYRFTQRIRRAYGAEFPAITLAVFGLSFKPQTDDIRESPALDIMKELHREGVQLRATDPVAVSRAAQAFGGCTFFDTPEECAAGADGVLLCTEWPQYAALNWSAIKGVMRQPVLFDGRNLLDPAAMRTAGWEYHGIGRP
ncbi:MAG: UDP-glucose 6-dehydrogenase TuaD [bacterium]|nr:UDP-glucose 6-dehydrogenase TuaD [bacterium]